MYEKDMFDLRTETIQSVVLQNRQRNKVNYFANISSVHTHIINKAIVLRTDVYLKYVGFYTTCYRDES